VVVVWVGTAAGRSIVGAEAPWVSRCWAGAALGTGPCGLAGSACWFCGWDTVGADVKAGALVTPGAAEVANETG
jgi:hypothetical protein